MAGALVGTAARGLMMLGHPVRDIEEGVAKHEIKHEERRELGHGGLLEGRGGHGERGEQDQEHPGLPQRHHGGPSEHGEPGGPGRPGETGEPGQPGESGEPGEPGQPGEHGGSGENSETVPVHPRYWHMPHTSSFGQPSLAEQLYDYGTAGIDNNYYDNGSFFPPNSLGHKVERTIRDAVHHMNPLAHHTHDDHYGNYDDYGYSQYNEDESYQQYNPEDEQYPEYDPEGEHQYYGEGGVYRTSHFQ